MCCFHRTGWAFLCFLFFACRAASLVAPSTCAGCRTVCAAAVYELDSVVLLADAGLMPANATPADARSINARNDRMVGGTH